MQYLQAGLAVLATNTRGQSELAAQAEGAVFLVDNGSPQSLAVEIRELAISAEKLTQARQIARNLSSTWLNWEGEKIKLLKLVKKALGR
ncbi:MAG: hypothetical protein IPG32_10135 [Saprospirales bacterium]|nr:hypothetical protein [Saprospirales bacterium]